MFYLPGKVIDTIERERIGCKTYLSFSSYLKSTAQQPGKGLVIIVEAYQRQTASEETLA
jgi:hypothetical protein